MFKIFPFQISGTFDLNQLWNITSGIGQIIYSILDNIDIDEISQQYEDRCSSNYEDRCSSNYETEEIEKSANDFIELKQDEDMYLLLINLKGINLRELSIRYNEGTIEINLNRLEMENNDFGIFSNNKIRKKRYRMEFKDIEDIDTSQLMKTIDNGILKIRMPKKYVINEFSNIIDVENYNENKAH